VDRLINSSQFGTSVSFCACDLNEALAAHAHGRMVQSADACAATAAMLNRAAVRGSLSQCLQSSKALSVTRRICVVFSLSADKRKRFLAVLCKVTSSSLE